MQNQDTESAQVHDTPQIDLKQISSSADYLCNVYRYLKRIEKAMLEHEQDAWYSHNLMDDFNNIITKISKAYEALLAPSLKIAFIGTTSSGKSTLLNGIMGHRLLPMDAGEMSAGVVHIQHSDVLSFTVDETENMKWQAGQYDNIHNDNDIYDILRSDNGIMESYRKALKKGSIAAPKIHITLPLAPKIGELPEFVLPEKIGLEFFDLPGIRTINDNKNLSVVQNYLANSFLVIVLDYNNTDEEKRNKLISEVQKIVLSICKNKKGFIFVLNKIDSRNSDDDPLEKRIQELKDEIRRVLPDIDYVPDIIPTCAQSYYYIRTAWNAVNNNNKKFFQEQLNNLFKYCGNQLLSISTKDQKFGLWFLNHFNNLDNWTQSDLEYLYNYMNITSNVRTLLKTICNNLKNNLYNMIILPSIGTLQEDINEFLLNFKNIVDSLSINNEQELQEEQKKIKQISSELENAITQHKNDSQDRLYDTIHKIKIQEFQSIADNDFNNIFRSLTDLVNSTIVGSIYSDIIEPVLDTLAGDIEQEDLKMLLHDYIPEYQNIKILQAVKSLIEVGYTGDLARNGKSLHIKKYPSGDHDVESEMRKKIEMMEKFEKMMKEFEQKEVESEMKNKIEMMMKEFGKMEIDQIMDKIEMIMNEFEKKEVDMMNSCKKEMKKLFYRVKQGIISYAEFLLQININRIESVFQNTMDVEISSLKNKLATIISSYQIKIAEFPIISGSHPTIKLDDKSIDFNLNMDAKISTEHTRIVDNSSCFKDDDQIITEQYYDDHLLSVEEIGRTWVDGVTNGSEILWDKFADGLDKVADILYNGYIESLKKTQSYIIDALNAQLQLNQNEREINYMTCQKFYLDVVDAFAELHKTLFQQ